jgi:hypothetical protein
MSAVYVLTHGPNTNVEGVFSSPKNARLKAVQQLRNDSFFGYKRKEYWLFEWKVDKDAETGILPWTLELSSEGRYEWSLIPMD